MIKKIFKTVLVLSLCLGITLPTNAAVSVSDGSAFVTKAEFAADLNNLSNRMAQLENSLDAKIDSLVSSYLTRNGIWNGAAQQVVYTSIPQGLGNTTSTSDVKMIHALYETNFTYSSQTVESPYLVTKLGDSRTNVLCIDNVSKTGLLRVMYDLSRISYTGNGGTRSDVLSIQPSKLNSRPRFSEQNFTIAQIYYYFHQDMWVNESTSSLGVIYMDCTAFASVIPNIENYGMSFYTFVERGKPLYITEKLNTSFPGLSQVCWKAVSAASVGGQVVFKLNVTSASVY